MVNISKDKFITGINCKIKTINAKQLKKELI